MGKVIIKCFETPKRKYLYDRFLNSVVSVNEKEYEILKDVEKTGKLPANNSMRRLVENGLLQNTILEKIEHPDTFNMKYLAKNCMQNLILQVTQQCNLRCQYCAYSGKYYNRQHSAERMSFETAKKAIDFYMDRSAEQEELCLSFYGGEPLLEFDLIQRCVEYIKEMGKERPIRFPMTTNGTLLTQEKIEFFVKHQFGIMISLDGEKKSHDCNRRFTSGEGSFDIIMKNLENLKTYSPSYYKEHVMFNAVISASTDLSATYNFFEQSQLFYPHAVHFNFVDPVDIKDSSIIRISEENAQVANFEYIKMLLSITSRRKMDFKAQMLRERVMDVEALYEHLHRHIAEGKVTHHGGPCVPGVRRLFVNTGGEFYPCERVSEENQQMCIGSLKEGLDYNKMNFFINHGKIIEKECIECWNLRECDFCINGIDKHGEEITREILLSNCSKSKEKTERLLQKVCIATEMGYSGHDNLRIFK